MIELEPRYVDVAIRRWQQLTDREATLADSDLSFDDIARRRIAATKSMADLDMEVSDV